jgi:glutamate-1-semialdehyde 2,1-aminomutase
VKATMVTYKELIETYKERTPKSQAEYEQARQWLPGGVGSAIQFQAPHPLYVERSEGARVWDLDGNEYVDYNLSFGAMVAGHANPTIVEAIQRQAEIGTLFGMPTALASELAAELRRRYPIMESMRFTNSGVEATSYAIRVARAATKKDKFIKAEGAYHGAMDQLLVSNNPHRMDTAGPAWDHILSWSLSTIWRRWNASYRFTRTKLPA